MRDVQPCPFCLGEMEAIDSAGYVFWRHPMPSDCYLAPTTITDVWLKRWNTRTPPPIDIAEALPEHSFVPAEDGHGFYMRRRAP